MKKLMLTILLILISINGVKTFCQNSAIENYNLSRNPEFQMRVQMLMIKSALFIIGEDLSNYDLAQVEKRHNLAVKILEDPIKWGDIMSRIVAAQGTLSAESLDFDIELTINSIWNDLSGIKFDD